MLIVNFLMKDILSSMSVFESVFDFFCAYFGYAYLPKWNTQMNIYVYFWRYTNIDLKTSINILERVMDVVSEL